MNGINLGSHKVLIGVHLLAVAVALFLRFGGAAWIGSLATSERREIWAESCVRDLEGDAIGVACTSRNAGLPVKAGPTSYGCAGQTVMVELRGDPPRPYVVCTVHHHAVPVPDVPPLKSR